MLFRLLICYTIFYTVNALTFTDCPFYHLQHMEKGIFSPNGEDGVTAAIMGTIGIYHGTFVELSSQEKIGITIISRILGIDYLRIDSQELSHVSDIIQQLEVKNVSASFEALVVRSDISPWWMLLAILRDSHYRPRVIIVDVNSMLGVTDNGGRYEFHSINSCPLITEYDPSQKISSPPNHRSHGANPLAYKILLNRFGYEAVYCESTGSSCFYVLRSMIPKTCPSFFPLPQLSFPYFRPNDDPSMSVVGPRFLSEELLDNIMLRGSSSEKNYVIAESDFDVDFQAACTMGGIPS